MMMHMCRWDVKLTAAEFLQCYMWTADTYLSTYIQFISIFFYVGILYQYLLVF